MMVNRWLLRGSIALVPLLPLGGLPAAAQAQLQTLARCEAEQTTVRVYDAGDGLMMRAFDRVNNIQWLDTPARQQANLAGTDYFNVRGEVQVRLYAPANPNESCFIVIGDNPPQAGRLIGDAPIVDRPTPAPGQPTAFCESPTYRVRVYNFRDRQMMRIESRQTGAILQDTTARTEPSNLGVDYFNNEGTMNVRLFLPSNSTTICLIGIDGNPPEQGTRLEATAVPLR
jgi:hypothetical protein